MRALTEALRTLPEYNKLLSRVNEGGAPVALGGLSPVTKALFAAAVREDTGRPIVFISADEGDASRIRGDLESITGERAVFLGSRPLSFYNAETVSREWEHARICSLYAISRGVTAVCAVESVIQRSISKEALLSFSFTLKLGGKYKLGELIEKLVASGYRRAAEVSGEGQFSVRGGILDIFSPAMPNPVRVEFFGDEIDSMGLVDTNTQRRVENVRRAPVLPVAETLPDAHPGGAEGLHADMERLLASGKAASGARAALSANIARDMESLSEQRVFPSIDRYMGLIYPKFSCAAHMFHKDAVVFIDEYARVKAQADTCVRQSGEDIESCQASGVIAPGLGEFVTELPRALAFLGNRPVIMADTFIGSSYDLPPGDILTVRAKQLPSHGGSFDVALSDISHYVRRRIPLVVVCGTDRRAEILCENLQENGIPADLDKALKTPLVPGRVKVSGAALSSGFECPVDGLCVISETPGPVQKRKPRPKHKKSARECVESYADLSPGDLVVHEHHGVGRFVGITKMPVDGVVKDYIKIAYLGTDALYVPATQLDLVSKYIGGGEDAPVRLSKLGGAEWQKSKSRAKAAAKVLAKELIALYAARKNAKGHAFSRDNDWQRGFEEAFAHEETDDQLRCAKDIKRDMQSSFPMDRLLCGDVGFGKTEVALRAVMKCVLDGKQAAMLVPTTVLAQQHYNTAVERFGSFPVKIEVLSRFRTPAQAKATLGKLSSNECDFLIGTHRILQKDISFKNLGLLIVDEEQRFGVSHKEKLKKLANNVDVLTLTATPIPRTLNMALSGMRDISVIEEAPSDRHPVQTYVMEHDWGVVTDAMRRELQRGGQVYYLHNHIETISRVASRIAEALPDASVRVAHGQMTERELSDVMTRMSEGEISILVCTTIIETGIDIPNVNTLIVEDADRMGLAQLHQIRGRVGRSSRHAFAYLTYRKGKILSEISVKRLAAIREFAEFGSGFKIAMRDLELRGAGNVLGAEQSGHMLNVGYDMYLRLLEEAVAEAQGKPPEARVECSTDINVSANIPESYVPSSEHRLELYRLIARVRTNDEASDMTDELCDRFGDPPREVMALLDIALLRAAAGACGISEILQKQDSLTFKLPEPDIAAVSALCSDPVYRRRLLFSAGADPHVRLRLDRGEDPLAASKTLISKYRTHREA